MTNTRELAKTIGRVFGLLSLLGFTAVSSASAETITKSFEIGVGTALWRKV